MKISLVRGKNAFCVHGLIHVVMVIIGAMSGIQYSSQGWCTLLPKLDGLEWNRIEYVYAYQLDTWPTYEGLEGYPVLTICSQEVTGWIIKKFHNITST